MKKGPRSRGKLRALKWVGFIAVLNAPCSLQAGSCEAFSESTTKATLECPLPEGGQARAFLETSLVYDLSYQKVTRRWAAGSCKVSEIMSIKKFARCFGPYPKIVETRSESLLMDLSAEGQVVSQKTISVTTSGYFLYHGSQAPEPRRLPDVSFYLLFNGEKTKTDRYRITPEGLDQLMDSSIRTENNVYTPCTYLFLNTWIETRVLTEQDLYSVMASYLPHQNPPVVDPSQVNLFGSCRVRWRIKPNSFCQRELLSSAPHLKSDHPEIFTEIPICP